MEAERLIVLKNVSEETVIDAWDGATHEIPAGGTLTVAFGLGIHFRDRHPGVLVVLEEIRGIAPEHVANEVLLVNKAEKPVVVYWDGVPYTFDPNEPVSVPETLAKTLTIQARALSTPDFPKGAILEWPAVVAVTSAANTITVSTLAKELGLKVKALVAEALALGIRVKNGKSPLSEDDATRLRQNPR